MVWNIFFHNFLIEFLIDKSTIDNAANQLEEKLSNGDDSRKILHTNCDPECDSQGCYGQGATQCIACRHYRLDNTCVSRCPPRSFPTPAAVCWPCHESCETCAGAGQDSCLTCAPAHLRVTDLAVCVQVLKKLRHPIILTILYK